MKALIGRILRSRIAVETQLKNEKLKIVVILKFPLGWKARISYGFRKAESWSL
jgi:hypothetical protein